MVEDLKVDLQCVVFLPFHASFIQHFLKNCGRDLGFGTTYVLKMWVGIRKFMIAKKIFHSPKMLSHEAIKFYGVSMALTMMK